jgi:hypothetical protein
MSDSALERLVAAHPLLFRQTVPPISSHLPAGWYELTDRLCTDIEQVLGAEGCASFSVRKIKEKFAALRLYYSLGDSHDVFVDMRSAGKVATMVLKAASESPASPVSQVRQLVEKATELSRRTCERCGESGQRVTFGGYVTTLCVQHEQETQRKYQATRDGH